MKYAFVNGIILDGSKDMQPVEGKAVLTDGDRIVGIDKETGTIESGKCADMIVVKDNPLDDLKALRNVSMVVAKGKLIRRPKNKKMKDIDAVLDKYM